MKKSTLLMIVSVVLAMTLSLGGTLAYLQDSDSDVNVMTLGNVYIEQIEQERDNAGNLVSFKDGKPLYPAVGTAAWDSELLDGKFNLFDEDKINNVVDKIVTVENTGKSAAYVRTIFAFEDADQVTDLLHVNYNAHEDQSVAKENRVKVYDWNWPTAGDMIHVTIDNVPYYIGWATYLPELAAGATTEPSLLQVFLDKTATNEDIAACGDNYDIMVLSQAVQTAGFANAEDALNEAFGPVTAANVATWFKGVAAEEENNAAAGAALLNGGTITLADDVYLTTGATEITKATTINLNGNTISSNHDNTAGADKYSTLTVYSDVTLNGPGAVENENGYAISVRDEKATLTINGGNYAGGTTAINVVKGTLVINGGYFEDLASEDNGHYLINCIDGNYKAGTAKVEIKGGTFKNWNPADNTSEGKNTNFVAEGYKSVSVEENTWTVVPENDVFTLAENSEELTNALSNLQDNQNATVYLNAGDYTTNLKIAGGKDVTIIGTSDTVLSGQIASTSSRAGTLTLKGVTVNVDNTIKDSTGISQTGKSAIALWGNQTVVCENVTFNMTLSDSTAITGWWDTGKGTDIVVRNCTFNCNGQRPIRACSNVTVENCTFNDPYRYAVQLTAKSSTASELDRATLVFKNNTIIDGENGKAFVYGVQLEGEEYGCANLNVIGSGNKIIADEGDGSTMYYCECGKVDHASISWDTEVAPVHAVTE